MAFKSCILYEGMNLVFAFTVAFTGEGGLRGLEKAIEQHAIRKLSFDFISECLGVLDQSLSQSDFSEKAQADPDLDRLIFFHNRRIPHDPILWQMCLDCDPDFFEREVIPTVTIMIMQEGLQALRDLLLDAGQ